MESKGVDELSWWSERVECGDVDASAVPPSIAEELWPNEPSREDDLEARDERVYGAISDALGDLTGQIEQLRDQLRAAENHKRFIIEAVKTGHWWQLRSELFEDDVESLSDVDDGGRIDEWLRNAGWS